MLPEPITPMKSAIMVRAPMHIPPNVAAMGIYLPKYFLRPSSLCPAKIIPYSFNYLATSLTELPETSIHVFENIAQVPSMNAMYNIE